MITVEELKETLAYGCRVLAFTGQSDIIWGHVSCRLPGGDTFLMKPAFLGLEEASPENIITVDLEGNKIEGEAKLHSEVPIHSEIYKMHSRVNCVVHTHPPNAVAFSSLDKELLPVGHEACLFYRGLPVYSDTTDLIQEKSRGYDLAKCLGDKNALLMRNHGIVTVGTTVGEAVMTAIILEKACLMHLLSLQFGGPKFWTDPEEAKIKSIKIYGEPGSGKLDKAFDYYVRQVRNMEAHYE